MTKHQFGKHTEDKVRVPIQPGLNALMPSDGPAPIKDHQEDYGQPTMTPEEAVLHRRIDHMRETIKEQGIENANLAREVRRLTEQVEWLKEVNEKKRDALKPFAEWSCWSVMEGGDNCGECKICKAREALDDDSDEAFR